MSTLPTAPVADFQAFQAAFAARLRDPRAAPRPAGVPARRMRVYQEMLFNNICGFLDRCFPVARQLLGEPRWRRLQRRFYRDWPLHTPWFHEIPREFVGFLAAAERGPRLPRYLAELAHYEWAELAVDVIDSPIPAHDPQGDLMGCLVALNPALMNLAYQWPVHRIGPDYRPRRPQPVCLVVFRDAGDVVRFVEVNPVTARLLALLGEAPRSGRAACLQIAQTLHHPDPEQLLHFGATLLADLRRQGIVLGTLPEA